jgi:carboxylate-amine ligase
MSPFTIGVEEEYQIVHAKDRGLRSRARSILSDTHRELGEDGVSHELFLSQIECGTPICSSLREVRQAVTRMRASLIRAANRHGLRIASAGTHPFSRWERQAVTPKGRYLGITDEFQQVAREEVIYGCHVHVGIEDPEVAIQVINRVRPWLPTLLSLTASSPFWQGEDTGYDSYRTIIFGRMPMVDVPHYFASRAEYDDLIRVLVATDSIAEPSRVYWDVRPSAHYPTVEFRICDAATTIDATVMTAALCRSLARTAHAEVMRGVPELPLRSELLKAAKWRAARFGMQMDLIDLEMRHSVPAIELVRKLLGKLHADLAEHNEWDEVAELVHDQLERGNGAARQRAAFQRSGKLEDVVDQVVEETARGTASGIEV